MLVQKLKAALAAWSLFATALFAADPPARDGAPGTVPTLPNPPAPKPVAEQKGPNKILLFRNGYLVQVDPDGRNEKTLTTEREAVHGDARLSPDGKKFAALIRSDVVGARRQTLHVRALDEDGTGTDLGVECKMLVSMLWSPDGAALAFAEVSEEGKKPEFAHFVVDVKTKEKEALKLPDGHLLTDWTRNGKFFLTTRFVADPEKPESRRARLYLVNRDGTEHKALTDEKQFSAFGRLSPDGTQVLYGTITFPKNGEGLAKRELAVFDLPTGKSDAVGGTPLNGEIASYCWSPDGKRIAYAWRGAHWGRLDETVNKETESHLVVCDPDGKNAKTIVSEKASSPLTITIGWIDWR
jgi:Tol biopolymer transport system component